MNVALWIIQGLLALIFLMTGIMKVSQPKEKLVKYLAYVEDLSAGQVKTIGILEILAVIGLILPAVTGILPWLTPVAAVGLVLLMIGAIITHLRRGEYSMIVINIVLLALAAFVAYGRFVLEPLTQ